MTKKSARKPIETNNLKFFVGKIQPIESRIAELEAELEPLQEQLARLKKGAKSAAESIWDESVERAANEWKSSRGDDELSIEWVDERYSQIPEEALAILEEHERYSRKDEPRDLMAFFDAVQEEVEGEEE
jgi:uncharacterized small protein (DUF1192 family)